MLHGMYAQVSFVSAEMEAVMTKKSMGKKEDGNRHFIDE